jgi:hypothetical protein
MKKGGVSFAGREEGAELGVSSAQGIPLIALHNSREKAE